MNNPKKNIENLEVIELCAGVGQTSIAVRNACEKLGIDMTINAFCEIDKQAARAYSILHGTNIPNLMDITKASFKGMRCDVLLATTPCTNISRIGNRKGFKEGSDTSSAIVWSVFRIVDELEELPKVIFFENVSAMIDANNIDDFNRLKDALELRGYTVRYKVMKASDYGVPQGRERIFIVCTFGNVAFDFDFPIKEELKVFLKDILEENPSSKYLMPTIKGQIDRANARGYSFRVHNPSFSKVAFTLTTKSRGQNSNNYVFLDDVTCDEVVRFTPNSGNDGLKDFPIRSLTRIEQGRLMGMSDEDIHKLDCISDTQFSKQMGNGVVIPVVEKIFINLLGAMLVVENEPGMIA